MQTLPITSNIVSSNPAQHNTK